MHSLDGLNKLQANPVLKTLTPAAGSLVALYTSPGSVDCEINVFRASNPGGAGDAQVWIGFSTLTSAVPNTVGYVEQGSPICDGASPDVFASPFQIPPNTTVWVQSNSGSVTFTMLAVEVGNDGVIFTGS